MASENTHAEVSVYSEWTSSGKNSDSSKDKATTHKNNRRLPKLLLTSALILLLLKTIFLSVAVTSFFQKYSQLLEEKNCKSSVSELIPTLECVRTLSPMEEKVWSCCPKAWKSFSSSCYNFSTDSRSWNESEENCLRMAAHLVVINTKEEQDFIIKNLDFFVGYYMGLLDLDGQNDWQWVDQTPYNQSATFWNLGEPNGKEERCVMLNFYGGQWGWTDILCHHDLRSVCETKNIYV